MHLNAVDIIIFFLLIWPACRCSRFIFDDVKVDLLLVQRRRRRRGGVLRVIIIICI